LAPFSSLKSHFPYFPGARRHVIFPPPRTINWPFFLFSELRHSFYLRGRFPPPARYYLACPHFCPLLACAIFSALNWLIPPLLSFKGQGYFPLFTLRTRTLKRGNNFLPPGRDTPLRARAHRASASFPHWVIEVDVATPLFSPPNPVFSFANQVFWIGFLDAPRLFPSPFQAVHLLVNGRRRGLGLPWRSTLLRNQRSGFPSSIHSCLFQRRSWALISVSLREIFSLSLFFFALIMTETRLLPLS